MPAAADHDERLLAPLRWWLLSAAFLASIWIAFWVSTPHWVALTCTAGLTALWVLVLVGYGSARVTVRDGVLTAGSARVATHHLGTATALDAAGTRRLAGRDADARAYLLLRPYVRRAVQVEVTDPADPTPYWLVASRHPDRLAAALTGSVAAARGAGERMPPPHRG